MGAFFCSWLNLILKAKIKAANNWVILLAVSAMCMDRCASVGCCMAQDWERHRTSTPCSFT